MARGDLEAAGAGPDQGDPLAGDVDVVVPRRGVKCRSRKGFRAGEVGDLRPVELADGGDDRVGPQRLGACGRAHRDVPHRAVPLGGDHLGVPPDVGFQVVAVHHIAEVLAQLGLLGEEVVPVVAGFEAVTVEVIGHVDAGAGIGCSPTRFRLGRRSSPRW